MNLLSEWAHWKFGSPPYVLEADRPVLTVPRSASHLEVMNWPKIYAQDDFWAPGDTKLHLGLLPHPFHGNLRRAAIYILLLNPGLSTTDYYGEYAAPAYRKALLATLKQQFPRGSIPFAFLDPQFSWHGGFGWWHGKLARVIECLSQGWRVSFAEARARLGSKLASIELVPYHSPAFHDCGWIRELHSVRLARAFVSEHVLPRVRRGDAIAIVTRKASIWNLPNHARIIKYSAQQARAAHLTPDSPGGSAILKLLLR